MIFNRTSKRDVALAGFLLCAPVVSGSEAISEATSWVDGGVRYAVVIHDAHDMTSASRAGSLLCRNELGISTLASQNSARLSLVTLEQLVASQGLRLRAIGVQRETKPYADFRYRTRCHAPIENIEPAFVSEPSEEDVAEARLIAGINSVSKGEYQQGLAILRKLRPISAYYQNGLPAIVTALLHVDRDLARKVDQDFLNLKEVTFIPSLEIYRGALKEFGWESRLVSVEQRIEFLNRRSLGEK